MTYFVIGFSSFLIGAWSGSEYLRWIVRRDLRSLPHRINEYTNPRKPW